MAPLNRPFLRYLLPLACLFLRIDGKCTLTPLQGDPMIAYVCVNGNMTDVAEQVPSDAEWIEFTVSRLNHLPPEAFSRFRDLRRLTFYNCDLGGLLGPEVFRGLKNLEWLVMSNTRLDVARARDFRHLTSLKRLTLDGAGLVYIEPEVFHGFPRLETLSLRDNDLDCLPIDALGYLRHLKTVQIGKNPWLCDCRWTIGKFLESRGIEHGPDENECRGSVREGRNVTDGSWRLTRVSNNRWECMTTIAYPNLPQAPDEGAPVDFHETRKYGRFEWRETSATSILSLDRLPDEIAWIQLHDILIPVLTHYAFFRFGTTLRSVEMKNCHTEHIEREAFAGLHKLERLSLIGNRFVTLRHDWFRDLSRLTDLVLRYNEISRFEDNALLHLPALRRLDLRGNRLRCLTEDVVRGPVALQRLEATENPWLCDCRRDLENYLSRMRIGYEISSTGRCDIPGQVSESEISTRQETSWNSTTMINGIMRWSWAYEAKRPSRPIPIRPTTLQPLIRTTPGPPATIRPPNDGCRLLRPTDVYQRADRCLCTRASLVDLVQVPDNVGSIVFTGSTISTLPNDAFRKFGRYLRELELRECGIQNIERRAFYGLALLETLVIRGNDLDFVRSEWFEDARNIRKLDISRNGISRISNGVFVRLPYLVNLDISGNHLNCLGIDHLEALQYLRELHIQENPWTCLCITRLVQFMKERKIKCNCNPEVLLHTSEGGWGCNGGDDYVKPTDGAVTYRPPVQPTTQQVSPPPPSTTYPSTTTESPLPWRATGSCYKIHNETGIHREGPLYHCSMGDISLLRKIPSYVRKIEITDSYILRLPPMAFARFENLTELVLRNCTLQEIDSRAFATLRNLEKLTLRENRFSVVREGWFRDTKNLVSLDMSDNRLVEIETDAFEGLEKLEYLNLEGNDLPCIYTSCFVGLPRLATLEFGRNPLKWRCWQELRQFLEIRAIGYTYYKCPHNGKDLVRNLLKDDRATAQQVNGAGSLDFTIFAIIFVICVNIEAF